MRLGLYLVFMGAFFGSLGVLARAAIRRGGPGSPGVQDLSIPLAFWGSVFYYGGLAALAAGSLLGLGQLLANVLG